MRLKLVPWILAIVLVGFFSWPSGTSAHGDEDHQGPAGGCATGR